MRFLIAAGLLVLSLLALLFGIAERTVWAPPPNHTEIIELDGKKPLILVPNAVLRMYPGVPTISAQGAKGSFISTGRESDVTAWIGAAGHESLEVDETGTQLVAVTPRESLTSTKSPARIFGVLSPQPLKKLPSP